VYGYRTVSQSIVDGRSSANPIGGSDVLLAILSKKHISFANLTSGVSLTMPLSGRLLGRDRRLQATGIPTGHVVLQSDSLKSRSLTLELGRKESRSQTQLSLRLSMRRAWVFAVSDGRKISGRRNDAEPGLTLLVMVFLM
jgi:hypothetical protein